MRLGATQEGRRQNPYDPYLGAIDKVGTLAQNYLAPDPLLKAMGILTATVIGVEELGPRSPCAALMPRRVVVRILVIAGVSSLVSARSDRKLHATPLGKISRVRCAIVLVINGRRRGDMPTLGRISTLHGTEVGEPRHLRSRAIVSVRLHPGPSEPLRTSGLLVERHRGGISSLQTSGFPEARRIYAHINVRVADMQQPGLVGFSVAVVIYGISESLYPLLNANVHAVRRTQSRLLNSSIVLSR